MSWIVANTAAPSPYPLRPHPCVRLSPEDGGE